METKAKAKAMVQLTFFLLFSMSTLLLVSSQTTSGAQTFFLQQGCSQYNATNATSFFNNRNTTFANLRSQLASSHFATDQLPRVATPIYAIAQCRDYLATADCLACFDAAVARIRNCSAANGARVSLDGCFLRYESNNFYDQGTAEGNQGYCGNRTTTRTSGFNLTVESLLQDLATATPRANGYYAASTRPVTGSNTTVYAVAQCTQTQTTATSCDSCLRVAVNNIARCPPDTDARAVDAGCFMRYSSSAFFSSNQTTDLESLLKSGSSDKKKKAIIGGVVGGFGLILILLILFLLLHTKKSKRKERGDILGATELRGPLNYRYKDLKLATKNFSIDNKLGEGGFGDVYKGTLKNGKIVAVKKLVIGNSAKAKADFESEVKLITNVHHRNLVRLLGCCKKGTQLLLVYEYMANGSLDKFLFGDRQGTLNWKQRFDVIVGMARGLAYLHEEFHACIIHRDIKSSNILLDDCFQPKIADFGLARLLPEDQSHLSTNFAGTLGYTAPEYAIHGQLSEKVDMYSFGVVVLEIVSGRRSVDIKAEAAQQYLLEWAWNLYEEERLIELVDPSLDQSEYDAGEVKKVLEVALMCTQASVSARPSMSQVVVMLVSRVETVQEPSRPMFIDGTRPGDEEKSTPPGSNATISTVQFSAR